MPYPPYSVLMSVYIKDDPNYLPVSINSMLSQTVKPDQFVIVEDGPLTIDLDNIIKEYKNKNPNLFTICTLKRNSGLAVALDYGLQSCRNELVARMDADDISLNVRCQKQLSKFCKNNNLSILGSNIDEFFDDPNVIISSRIVPSDYAAICKQIKIRDPFNHPTVMFKKTDVIRCGGYGTLRRCQDYDLFSRMINMGCYAENINESLLLFRSNEDNYIRRKSKEACENTIKIAKLNYQRGYTSFFDYIFVFCAEKSFQYMPLSIMKFISDNLLRKKKQ